MLKRAAWIFAGLLVVGHLPAEARATRGGAAVSIPTCPKGVGMVQFDLCTGANSASTYSFPALFTTYLKNSSGAAGTLQHAPPYNVAGYDFPVGPYDTTFKDPFILSFTSTGSSINHFVLTIGGLTQGQPNIGQYLWNTNTGALVSDHPKIIACLTGCVTPGNGSTYTLDKDEGTGQTAGTVAGSVMPGCLWTPTGAFGATSNSYWACNFNSAPNIGISGEFPSMEWGAIGGHAATILRVTASSSLSHIKAWNQDINLDALEEAAGGVSVIQVASGAKVDFDIQYSNLNGGNDAVAPGALPAAFVYKANSQAVNFAGIGSVGGVGNCAHHQFKYNYIHGWASNPVAAQLAYTCIDWGANVWINWGMNNGNDTAGGETGLHGATTQFGATLTGTTNYYLHRYNETIAQPYGFRGGVTTSGLAVLGGISSAITMSDVEIAATTTLVNVSNATGPSAPYATQESNAQMFRIAGATSFKFHDNYSNNVGAGGCVLLGGDLQIGSTATASMAPNGGVPGHSIWTVSGFSGQVPLPYPGQPIAQDSPSHNTQFAATLADNGNSTSTLTITATYVGTTTALAAGTEIVALRLTDPVLIVSGSGSTYIVSGGQTRASQTYNVAQKLLPFGTDSTTATGGTTVTNYNGTWAAYGSQTVTPANNQWSATSAFLGNSNTFDADSANNYDMQTAGSAGLIKFDGIGLNGAGGQCPNTGSL